MTAELGIGVRVYSAWRPGTFSSECCCRNGTVKDGPFDARTYIASNGRRYRVPCRHWHVRLDGQQQDSAIAEEYLFPIDDGDEQISLDEREPERETA